MTIKRGRSEWKWVLHQSLFLLHVISSINLFQGFELEACNLTVSLSSDKCPSRADIHGLNSEWLVCGWLEKFLWIWFSVWPSEGFWFFCGGRGSLPQETMFLQLQIQTDNHNTHLQRQRGPVQYKFSTVPYLELHVTVQTKPVVACTCGVLVLWQNHSQGAEDKRRYCELCSRCRSHVWSRNFQTYQVKSKRSFLICNLLSFWGDSADMAHRVCKTDQVWLCKWKN